WALAARAQQAGKVARLGWLRLGSAADFAGRVEALRTGLRELGYVEGKDIVIEFRWPETVDQLSKFAAELVRMNVDIIFASSSGWGRPASNPDDPHRVRNPCRPRRHRACGESRPSRREHHWALDASH